MKNLKCGLSLALLGLASHAFAQSEVDALRYSRLQFGGPARTQGFGGATSALGANLGSLVTNPAGLGLYVKSDISFTPGYSQTTSKTQTGAANLSDTRSSLNIGNFGIAFTNRLPDDDNTSEWRSGTFAFGITRLNDFNQRYRYRNTTTDNRSLFQRFREPRVSYDDIDNEFQTGYTSLDGLAYGTYLSEFVGTPPNDALVLTPRNGEIVQEETVQTSGAQTQFDFGYGASFRDKLYIGGALGIVSTRYNETRDFTETENDPSTPFTSLLRRNTLETQGTGVNFRLGLIYRPTDMVRLGASVQTPTFSKLTDSYGASLRTNFSEEPFPNTGTSRAESTAPGEYSYNLTTPFRATGGAAVILGKYGFVTGDVEYVNYSQARLNGDGSDSGAGVFDVENEAVSNTYGSAVNFRGGVEGRFDVFRVRAGFAHNGDPFKTSTFNRAQNYFTGGLGLYQRNVYIDLAGVYNTDDSYTSAYTLASGLQPVIGVKTNRFTTSVTVGVNF